MASRGVHAYQNRRSVTRAGCQALCRLPLWPPHFILSGPLCGGRFHRLGLRERALSERGEGVSSGFLGEGGTGLHVGAAPSAPAPLCPSPHAEKRVLSLPHLHACPRLLAVCVHCVQQTAARSGVSPRAPAVRVRQLVA